MLMGRIDQLLMPAILVLAIFTVVLLWFTLPPIALDTGTVNISDNVTVNLTTVDRLNEQEFAKMREERTVGHFEGHEWPNDIPRGEPVILHIAADRPRDRVLRTCTHEMWHYRLEQEDVSPFAHHAVMEDRDVIPIRPWEWKRECLKILPNMLV